MKFIIFVGGRGGHEKTNIATVTKILDLMGKSMENNVNFEFLRLGQDMRYVLNDLNDLKLRKLEWELIMNFDKEVPKIVEHYENKFIW